MVVLAGSLTLLLLTRTVWAHFGLFNYVIALGLPYGLSLLVRHVQVDGRNPLAVTASSIGLLTRPSGGRLGGSPLRGMRGRRALIGVCSVTWAPAPVGVRAGGAASVPRAAQAGAAVPRSTNAGRPGPDPRPEREATGAGGAVVEQRPVPVAVALLAARRRGIREDVSDPRVARRGV
ncbi:hypothetical protein [Streptomyces sp. NPDC056010]|uniref:hypothetical protein n=1 Tax=Streptomyces sp. NPDC056010 TaxID=3345679 RepID=UPI0035DA997E